MKTSDFDFHLPLEQIAQAPVEPRDSSRLLVVDRAAHTHEHKHFFDLVEYLEPGDLIVWNNSKVFKARLFGLLKTKEGQSLFEHGKQVEVFLVREMENPGVWKILAKPGKHFENGMRVVFAEDFWCDVILKEPDGTILVQFEGRAEEVRAKANQYGQVPLPPYVKDEKHQLDTYQNVYASQEKEGSVAAPTAGFHFTDDLITRLKEKGVQFAEVTLHVGLGTFLPVKSERVEDHVMHSEWVELSQTSVDAINAAKAEGRRVIAVGTTTVRTLEGIAAMTGYNGTSLQSYHGDINLFIRPGFGFQIVDALITNFHLPKSTLLMLVSAFVGDHVWTLDLYNIAVEERYRFFSFGDAMLIV